MTHVAPLLLPMATFVLEMEPKEPPTLTSLRGVPLADAEDLFSALSQPPAGQNGHSHR